MKPVERLCNPFDVSIVAFVKERLIEGKSLVITMGVLWREYRRFSVEAGYPVVSADQFAEYFECDSRLSIFEGQTGRAVNGVGFRP